MRRRGTYAAVTLAVQALAAGVWLGDLPERVTPAVTVTQLHPSTASPGIHSINIAP